MKKKSDKDKMLIFTMSTDVAMEFWQRVKDNHLETELERRMLLLEMTKEGKMQSVSETTRSKEDYIKDMSKEFKIIDVSPKYDEENNNESTS